MTFGDDELDTYSAIYERDVDIVLVMALRSSAAVRALVCAAVGVPAEVEDPICRRHAPQSRNLASPLTRYARAAGEPAGNG